MAFYLGSAMQGLFSGAQDVFGLNDAYQNAQIKQAKIAVGNAIGKATAGGGSPDAPNVTPTGSGVGGAPAPVTAIPASTTSGAAAGAKPIDVNAVRNLPNHMLGNPGTPDSIADQNYPAPARAINTGAPAAAPASVSVEPPSDPPMRSTEPPPAQPAPAPATLQVARPTVATMMQPAAPPSYPQGQVVGVPQPNAALRIMPQGRITPFDLNTLVPPPAPGRPDTAFRPPFPPQRRSPVGAGLPLGQAILNAGGTP